MIKLISIIFIGSAAGSVPNYQHRDALLRSIHVVKRNKLFQSIVGQSKMLVLKSCFVIYIICSSYLINAQTTMNKSNIKEMLEGTWNCTGTSTLPKADTLGLLLQPEEVRYMIFEGNHVRVRFSSFIDNEYHEGRYSIYYDNKSNHYNIKFKKAFGSCETKSVQVVAITDSSLVIRSCINPVDINFKKSQLPNEKIRNLRNLLFGSWHYVETTTRNRKYAISNSVDSLVSYEFSKDSVVIHVMLENRTKVIKSDYSISYNLDYDKFSIYTPLYVRESCDPIPVLYIDSIVDGKMILTKCDNDHYQVIYEK